MLGQLIIVIGNLLSRGIFYFSAALGGLMMGIVDLLTNFDSDAPIDANDHVLVFHIGEKLSSIFHLPIGAGVGSGEAIIGLAFLSLVGFLIVFLKPPKDKWESFMAGFSSFAILAALVSPNQPLNDVHQQNSSPSSFIEMDTSSWNELQPTSKVTEVLDKITFITAAYAREVNSLEEFQVKKSDYLLYIKGGRYLRPLKTVLSVYNDEEEFVGKHTYSGNRERLSLDPGSYRLNVYVKTHGGQEFQFFTYVEVELASKGGFIDLEAANLQPVGLFSKFTRQFQSAAIEPLSKVDLFKQLGLYNLLSRNYVQALSGFETALSAPETTNAQSHQLQVLKGYTFYRTNQLPAAREVLERAYVERPNENHAWINLVKVLCKMNDIKNANRVYSESVKSHESIVSRDGEFRRDCGTKLESLH